MIKKIAFLTPLFLSSLFGFGFNNHTSYEDVKPVARLAVSSIDTSGAVQTYKQYPDEFLDDIFNDQLDELVSQWYIQNAFNMEHVGDTSLQYLNLSDLELKELSTIPDSVYIERLQSLDFFVDMSFNKTVKNVITLYTERRRSHTEMMLGLGDYYFPMIEQTLDKYDLPHELKYMSVIESALNPTAMSRVGACGLWQFMLSTGKGYGLEVNTFVDERRDPVKATDAAARFLKDLYKIYGDWHLVIAAYNCGPGNVNKAIRRSGGKRDYWSIYYRLPRETRGYVPAYIAAAYSFEMADKHHLKKQAPSFDILTDTVMVNDYIHFDQIVNTIDISLEELRYLNPSYRRDIIPARPTKPYALRLPHDKIIKFIDRESHVMAYKRETYFPNNEIKNPSSSKYKYEAANVKGKTKVYYKVKSGDAVGLIADWFDVRTSDLRYWNNIRGNMIRVGQKLLIYVPSSKSEYYESFNSMTYAQKQQTIGKTAKTNTAKSEPQPIDSNYNYYTVRSGDSFYTIAQKYPGISAENIMQLNGIKSAKGLKPGQKLKVMLR